MNSPYAHTHSEVASIHDRSQEQLRRLSEAALRLLKLHGEDRQPETGEPNRELLVQHARVAGFTLTYFCCEPGRLSRTKRTNWITRQGSLWDPQQHVIDVEVGSKLLGMGWRGDGPIERDTYLGGCLGGRTSASRRHAG